jgi:hypothetical protein
MDVAAGLEVARVRRNAKAAVVQTPDMGDSTVWKDRVFTTPID